MEKSIYLGFLIRCQQKYGKVCSVFPRALKVEHTPLISKECGTVVRLIKKLSQVDF